MLEGFKGRPEEGLEEVVRHISRAVYTVPTGLRRRK